MPVADSLSDCEEVFTADEPEARSTIPHHLAIAPSCSLLERWWNSRGDKSALQLRRDLGEWDQLRSLFHPDATIDITWFTGKAGDFQAIYDICTFTFPTGFVELDEHAVQKYPREYAPLAYILEKSGFPVNRVYPTKGSDLEKTIKAKGQTWLKA